MRLAPLGIALLALSFPLANGPDAHAQGAKKGGATSSAASYRTLTGKVGEVKAADQSLTIEVGEPGEAKSKAKGKGKAAGSTWNLSVGHQTLLLRAGRNGQFSTIELADVKAGDAVQAVVELQASEGERMHNAWWLVVYPTGTTPPER